MAACHILDLASIQLEIHSILANYSQMHGGEGALLDELELGGMVCDPMTQLVVLCEVCGRPSTKECWTCKMPICSFCTLKRHWKVSSYVYISLRLIITHCLESRYERTSG